MKKSLKLRTRIIISCCVTIGIALFLSELFIWIVMARNTRKQAVFQAYEKFYGTVTEVEKVLDTNDIAENLEVKINYLLKQKNDPYNICYESVDTKTEETQVKEIYNGTTLSYRELSNINYEAYMTQNADLGFQYGKFNYEGRNYVVFVSYTSRHIEIYRVEDITYVKEKMIDWAMVMIGIIVIVFAFTVSILSLILRRNLRPLGELSDRAKLMSKGEYEQRIEIKRHDEIGQLGENFNKMAETVQKQTESLMESEQRKTIFMGDLTHELKTPMTAISGYAQTLLNTKISEEDREEALRYIVEQCNRLERMSRKMMRLLELAQTTEIEMKEIAIERLFVSVQKTCDKSLKDKNIELQIVEQGEHFCMDVDLMENVLINLIDNAVKASEPGSKVILRAYNYFIEVQDFGRGIPKEEQDKILEPFYMVDKSRSRKSGGAGLGLSLVVVILQKHNVTMTIHSEEGKGSLFRLEF